MKRAARRPAKLRRQAPQSRSAPRRWIDGNALTVHAESDKELTGKVEARLANLEDDKKARTWLRRVIIAGIVTMGGDILTNHAPGWFRALTK